MNAGINAWLGAVLLQLCTQATGIQRLTLEGKIMLIKCFQLTARAKKNVLKKMQKLV